MGTAAGGKESGGTVAREEVRLETSYRIRHGGSGMKGVVLMWYFRERRG